MLITFIHGLLFRIIIHLYNQLKSVYSLVINEGEIEESEDQNDQALTESSSYNAFYVFHHVCKISYVRKIV